MSKFRSLIQKINSYGASNGINSHVATLWRHLGYWPNFLNIINVKFKPLNERRNTEIIITIEEKIKKFFLSPKKLYSVFVGIILLIPNIIS